MSAKRTSSRLLIDEQPLQVIPSLACKMGLNRAMFLQQLHYWLQKRGAHTREGRRWVFNSFEEWHRQFPFWSAEAIRKIVSRLEAKGVIETTDRFNERKGDRTKWYTINYEALNALFDATEAPSETAPENSPQSPDHPDKSTEQPENIPHLEPDKSTERYQRVPETNNRDSDLQSGEVEADASDPPEDGEEKNQPKERPGAFGCRELMERVEAARGRGAKVHDPPDIANYGRFFANRFKRHEVETLLFTLDFLVAKASGEVDGEPKAWCGFDTALDHVTEGGWRPKRTTERTEADLERLRAFDEETERLLAEARAEKQAREFAGRAS